MPKGFRDFIMRGNVVDLAVAFVPRGAFATVVTSFVGDILTPLLALIGVLDFSTLVWTTPRRRRGTVRVFLNARIAFVLVAAAIYCFVVKPVERLRRPAEAMTKTCPECGSEIPLAARRCPMCTSQLAG